MSLLSFSYRGEGFFFYVSGVVTNARSAQTVGASVEELTCSKNQCPNMPFVVRLVEVSEGVQQHPRRSTPIGKKKSLSCLALESL
jgi:hypothetical protein